MKETDPHAVQAAFNSSVSATQITSRKLQQFTSTMNLPQYAYTGISNRILCCSDSGELTELWQHTI